MVHAAVSPVRFRVVAAPTWTFSPKDGVRMREEVLRWLPAGVREHVSFGFEAVAAFGMDPVLPFSAFADRAGRIVTLKVGELHRDEADFILDRMRELDQGRLSLAAAREQIAAGISRLNRGRSTAAESAVR